MKKTLTILTLILALMGLAVSCKNADPTKRAEFMVNKVSKKLALSEAQKLKLTVLKDKMLSLYAQKQKTKEDFHKDVKSLLTQDVIREDQIKSLLDRKRNQIDQILPEVLPEFIDFHASLTPEQKEKLVGFLEKFTKERHGGKHH